MQLQIVERFTCRVRATMPLPVDVSAIACLPFSLDSLGRPVDALDRLLCTSVEEGISSQRRKGRLEGRPQRVEVTFGMRGVG